jgi:hypothetical protein
MQNDDSMNLWFIIPVLDEISYRDRHLIMLLSKQGTAILFGLLVSCASAFSPAVRHAAFATRCEPVQGLQAVAGSDDEAVKVRETTHTLYYVKSIADIDAGKPQWTEEIDALELTNDKGVTVTAMPRGANMVELSIEGKNYVWENKAGATYYGAQSNSFPLSRGLILNGGVRFAAVTAEHGLYYDTDWDMSWEGTGNEKTIVFKIEDTQEQRFHVKDPFSVGQFNRQDDKSIQGTMTKYPVTNMVFTYKITLKAGEDFVRLSMTVDNPTDKPCNAEAWLPMTFPINKDSEILSHQKTRWRRDEWWNGFLPNVIEWANVENSGYDFNKPLSWPKSGIFYDFPGLQGKFHGCTIDEPGKGVVYYAPETSPHHTKMWGWGNPDNFNRNEALANDPLAAGRPYTEYYEPRSSGFNFAFFQTTEFKPKRRYNWEIAILPIPQGVTGSLAEKLAVVDAHIAAREKELQSIADVTDTPL